MLLIRGGVWRGLLIELVDEGNVETSIRTSGVVGELGVVVGGVEASSELPLKGKIVSLNTTFLNMRILFIFKL